MTKYTDAQRRLLDTAREQFGTSAFTPTQIGMALGHNQVFASSRVADHLRILVEAGALIKTKTGHNRATYSIVEK